MKAHTHQPTFYAVYWLLCSMPVLLMVNVVVLVFLAFLLWGEL